MMIDDLEILVIWLRTVNNERPPGDEEMAFARAVAASAYSAGQDAEARRRIELSDINNLQGKGG
jgi:hypothetical protein